MPYPMFGRPFLKLVSTRATNLAGAGAPPPPMEVSELVSYFWKLSHSSMSHDCVGTPTKLVTLWRSMSCRARSGSQRYIITNLKCQVKQLSITGIQPVT